MATLARRSLMVVTCSIHAGRQETPEAFGLGSVASSGQAPCRTQRLRRIPSKGEDGEQARSRSKIAAGAVRSYDWTPIYHTVVLGPDPLNACVNGA